LGVFEGGFEKGGCFWMVFCGGVVVNCMVERGELHGCFLVAKNLPCDLNFSVEIAEEAKSSPPAARKDDKKERHRQQAKG
jgi:hypothetical protein